VFHLARARRELNSLKQTRTELKTDVRRLIDELSPEYASIGPHPIFSFIFFTSVSQRFSFSFRRERGEEFTRHGGVHREMKQKWRDEEDEGKQDGLPARKRVLYRRRSYKKLDEFSEGYASTCVREKRLLSVGHNSSRLSHLFFRFRSQKRGGNARCVGEGPIPVR
jgi:hypothetical protein